MSDGLCRPSSDFESAFCHFSFSIALHSRTSRARVRETRVAGIHLCSSTQGSAAQIIWASTHPATTIHAYDRSRCTDTEMSYKQLGPEHHAVQCECSY